MKGFKHILIRATLFSCPFLLIIFSYLATDPFKVILVYSLYTPTYKNICTDVMRTNILLKGYESEHFNTFTFGNSQIEAFNEVYPESIAGSSFHDFHNPGESIWNIYKKVHLIDSLGLKMDHVLLCINSQLIENVRNSNPAYHGVKYIHHPLTSGEDALDFQIDCFKFYLADFYFIKYWDFNLFNQHRAYMDGSIPKGLAIYEQQDAHATADEEIQDRLDFYAHKKEIQLNVQIDSTDRILLMEIEEYFKKHVTALTIVFPPNSEIEKMDSEVVQELRGIFGSSNVYDFTGINDVIQSEGDFVDKVHFHPRVAKRILDEIQKKDLLNQAYN